MFCRKGKARCDGLDNWPCRRCRENGVECVFEGLTPDELRSRMNVKRESQQDGGSIDGTGSV
jgi:transcriptional/translational regulatory protein YebC/TACO1